MSLSEASPANVNRTMLLLALAAFASQAMVRAVDTLLPQIAMDFRTSIGAASIVVTVYAIAHGASLLIAGPVGDRLGKVKVVTIACAISAGMVLSCGLAQSMPALAAARFASGMAVAWIVPLGLAFVGDVVPDEERQHVLARYMSGQILGQLFGQAAGGVLGDVFGWRGLFFVLASLFALVAAALAWQVATDPHAAARDRAKAQARPIGADYVAVLSNPWARIVLLAVFFEGMLSFGTFAFVGADLHSRLGLGLTSIGAIVALFAVGGLLYGALAGPLVRWMGPVNLAIAGGGLAGCGFLLLAAQATWRPAPFAVAAIGVGFYMLHNTLLTNATQMCPQVRGTAVSAFGAALYLGQTAGVAIAGAAIDGVGSAAIFLGSGVLLPVVAVWFGFQLHRRSGGGAPLAQACRVTARDTPDRHSRNRR